jgi:leucyl aminopeptidase (aminopeptidase T)
MKSPVTFTKGARMIIEHCMTVKADDKVLIIMDDEHMLAAQSLAGVAFSLGAYPVIANVTHHVALVEAEMAYPMEPPAHLAQAMLHSDEIIVITNVTWAHRIPHTDAVKKSVENGAKIASIEEGMGGEWNMEVEDIELISERTRKILEAMEGAKWARVTNPAGTDVRVCIEGRPPLEVVPVKGPGVMMGPIPMWGEVAWAAVEDKTEGRIVVDGIMIPIHIYGTLPTPIEWTVKNGRAIDISGGEEAQRLKALVEGADSQANVIAEFAIGTSHKEKLGSPYEKGMMGTVHFALGDNVRCYPGGQSLSNVHLDGSLRDVTIEVDGRVIIKDGELVI